MSAYLTFSKPLSLIKYDFDDLGEGGGMKRMGEYIAFNKSLLLIRFDIDDHGKGRGIRKRSGSLELQNWLPKLKVQLHVN